MNKHQLEMIAATLLCLVGTGCATIEQHPRVSAFIAGSLVLTAGGALRHSHAEPMHEPDFCGANRELCK